MAMRRTPSSARRATAAMDRTPPPQSTLTPGTWQMARMAAAFAAQASSSSSKVAERSTTWIHSAPAAAKSRATEAGSSE